MSGLARNVAKVSRRVRFPGREKLLRTLFSPESFRKRGSAAELISYDKGLKMWCDLTSYFEWCVFFKGYYERTLVSLLKRLVKRGFYCMDVGANVGAFTLIMAQQVGPTGSVFAFEPNSEVYERLVRNLAVNELSGSVRTYSVAISSENRSVTLFLPSDQTTNRSASLVRRVGQHGECVYTEARTLDSYASELRRCDLIKVDTDGHDYEVLLGAQALIRDFTPAIIFEFSPQIWPDPSSQWKEIEDGLRGKKYRLFNVSRYRNTLQTIERMPEEEVNVVALSPKHEGFV